MKPFERGIKDFKDGNMTSIYPVDSMPYKEWSRGFNTAYFENLKKVRERELETGVSQRKP